MSSMISKGDRNCQDQARSGRPSHQAIRNNTNPTIQELAEPLTYIDQRSRDGGLTWELRMARILAYHVIELKRVCGRLRDAPSCRNGSKNQYRRPLIRYDMIKDWNKKATIS
ncbi:hypothetical protein TNCV_3995821 [Trichonephila clavipes]|nr:hypothetical protein TNCV_3995821 [Trichonephila clavipes]